MTTTTATKVDPFQKEHIPTTIGFLAWLKKDFHTSRESNALIFVEIASSLVFPFPPHLLHFCFVKFFPPSLFF